MSDERGRGKGPEEKGAAGGEGWEGFASEPSEGTLEPSNELEEAMREAAEAVDARHAKRRPEAESRVSSPPAGEVEADEVTSLRQELAEARDRLLRLAADFDNFRKRALKDREEAHHFGHQNLVKDLLPSVDNLERAVDLARQGGEGAGGGLLEGVELVLRELHAVLAKHGVTPIEALGQPFDPALHEAMAQVIDATKPPNTVVQVYQRGYQLRARLLRPARVVVSKAPEDGAGGGSNG
jgi:molecular chaperone GrpE